MTRRIFSPREIILPKAKLVRGAILWGKLVMPILLLAWFFVLGPAAQAGQTILYQENFNSGQAAGWQEQADSAAVWQIKNGQYNLNISYYNNGATSIYQNGLAWQDYSFSFDIDLNDGVDRSVIFRRQDDKNLYSLGLRGFWRYAPDDTPVIYLQRCYQGQCVGHNYWHYFAAYHFNDNKSALNHETAHIDIQALGNRIKVYYNQALVIDYQEPDDNYPKFGTIGFSGWTGDYETVDVSWDNLMVKTLADEPAKPDPVIIVPGIMGSWKVSGKWELDPILHTYDNLWQALKNAGYEEGKTLFAFPYEWRQDNTITAYQLKQKIDEVKSICNCDKVDIVAHSMGGIVARYYAESDYYGHDIDQLVFLGTPHKGSPEAYLRWEGADGFESVRARITKLYLSQEAHNKGYNSLFDYIQGYIKSVKQLLPDYAYLQNLGEAGFRIYDKISYPNNYPYNDFLENINSADKINQFAHSGIKIMNFIGDTGDGTINAIKVGSGESYWPMWKHGYAEESIRLTGDGTVPEISSSLFIPTKINNTEHSVLPTKAQKQVIQYLTGNLPIIEITDNKEPKKVLVVRIFSPADFVITAPDGKRLGKDFLSEQAVKEIPGAFYSGFDSGAEFAVIPDPADGEYKVELQGTGQGEYKLSASLISDDKEIDQEFSGSIAPGVQRDFTINYLSAAESPLSDLAPIDTAPPVVTINKLIEGDKYLHSDNLIIDYSAIDDFSGIATTSMMIDGQAVAMTTVDLFDYQLGTHSLTVKAVDKTGNQAEKQVNFEIIANIDSTISDIEKIHERGWLTDRIYEKLLKDTFKLLKIETKYFTKERELNEKLSRKTQDDSKLTDKQKQKIIEQYNRKLAELKINRQKAINRSLDLIIRLLNKAKDKNLINQAGYDIIMSNVNYLRENL